MGKKYDLMLVNGSVVQPGGVSKCAVAIRGGKIVALGVDLDAGDADRVVDARGLTIMPGAVDCHTHLGIYRPLQEDADTETKSALVGGVTTMLNYFRTGTHYMNKTGAYHDILPEAKAAVEGRAYCDYGFHLAPMDSRQVSEMEWLAKEAGVTTFKYFMFYKGLNLGANSTDAAAVTMSDCYDLGHLYNIMEEASRLNQEMDNAPISVSVHCEDDEIIKAFIQKVNAAGLSGLRAYSEARPPLSERVAILKAGTVADATACPLNVLHITSRSALQATRDLLKIYPSIRLRRECTLHALGLTYDMLEGKGLGGKVNPPIRTKEDGDALWDAVVRGEIDWIGSDHANTPIALKGDALWPAHCGFGGVSLLYPYMISAGYHDHKLPLERIAALVSTNPAKAHACYPRKGSIQLGADADFALIDLDKERTVTTALCMSAQEYTPFEGMKLKGWPVMTILRGNIVFNDGQIEGEPQGVFLKRPC